METGRVECVVDLGAVARNTRSVRAAIGGELCAVVKADAYGHGALAVARKVLEAGAASLAVAICEEAADLRENGVTAPILILGYVPPRQLEQAVEINAAQTVFHAVQARELAAAARRRNKTAAVHIKIDTGMGRLGFFPDAEGVSEIAEICRAPNLDVRGVYTHLATSDEPGSPFVYEQREKFENFRRELAARGLNIPAHIANSGAIVNNPDIARDKSYFMARAGITLYGLPPANGLPPAFPLFPAMSLRAEISYVKLLPEGVSVGYARSFTTSRPTVVGTVPVGYADGYPRALSNRGQVIVSPARGEPFYAPVIGKICMDQLMIDVTGAGFPVKAGDEVLLMGGAGGLSVSADGLAERSGTINYEIVCGIGKRVPRRYID
ncbi:MAG: alanine racemase [Clostridiales bacterium]|nr:alanine racemase [Clostridiales bacterium]